MCKSVAEGGQRCAAHTRARLSKIADKVQAAIQTGDHTAIFTAREEWIDAAAEYASTTEGHQHFTGLRDQSATNKDYDTAAMLNTVVNKGDAIRAANKTFGKIGTVKFDQSEPDFSANEVSDTSSNGLFLSCPTCNGNSELQKNCDTCVGRGQIVSVPFCDHPWDQIAPGLYLGGHDCQPGGGETIVDNQFDMVVSLYQREGYGPADGVVNHVHTMIDGPLSPEDYPRLHELTDLTVNALQDGKTVLIRCQAGLNRSALVSALVLMKQGWTLEETLNTMRNKRSRYVLFNQNFVEYLKTQENLLRKEKTRCDECSGYGSFFGADCEVCGGKGYINTI